MKREPALRTYHSYVGGRDIPGAASVYVVSGRALLDDAFASLALKRRLERGGQPDGDLPPAIVGKVARADRETVLAGLRSAAEAAPEWGATPPEVRITGVGKRIHDALIRHADTIVEVLVHEGHPVSLARWQVSGMLECFGPQSLGFYLQQSRQEYTHGRRTIVIRRRADGVVCLNPPQNAPLSSALLGATSIMAGNALVVRAPRSAPLGVMFVMRELVAPALEEVGAPAGTLNLVCGDPAAMLSLWLESPLVDDVMYFGTSENGLRFQERCVAAGKKPILELAGNDVVAVWKDADLEQAAVAVTEGCYGSGQLCMVPNQVLVHPAAADELLRRLVGELARLRPGHPDEDGVLLTPVLRNEKFFDCLRDALGKGATLVCGGHAMQLDGTRDDTGMFLEPTVVRVDGMARAREIEAVRRETFFPLIPVVVAEPAPDDVLLDRFIGFVNTNEYGLRNSIWARDEAVVERFVSRIGNGGLLKVNDSHIGFLPYLPTHGGTGLTGGVYGEANYPVLRTSHLQGVSLSPGERPREAVFSAWEALAAREDAR
ncbi:aldehyde dehydrogenase family protein [Streptosporangiaceae bacterium NEAU-GS5]|nr:aldehyde dehydrogenase family protein [Streptosporangiaceae bacterium NEAU-GS5]